MSTPHSIRPFQPKDLAAVAAAWNRFWASTPRGFAAEPDEFAARVLLAPGFADTTMLVAAAADGAVRGFAHFGPREPWWFLQVDRRPPDPSVGMIYTLCAEDAATFTSLLHTAEAQLAAQGAEEAWLWPSWAQGAIPLYNGLTSSNEVSGLWSRHVLVDRARASGYEVHGTYAVGTLSRKAARPVDTQRAAPWRRDPITA